MKGDTPITIYLKDYKAPDYRVEKVQLTFNLKNKGTQVFSRLTISKNHHGSNPLVLDGKNLVLNALSLDDKSLREGTDYQLTEDALSIQNLPDRFELVIETQINPADNTSLEGLYKSNSIYCTQCEAEGFRAITYYLDRPDVMASFTTTIIANKDECPVLLSNGNLISAGENDDGTHWVTWEDPHKKPSYLFALVAGDLEYIQDKYITSADREVDLRIYVEAENLTRCDHAMTSLKKAMQWDEQEFGLEYDLDIYMIVAVNDFNAGAMENKGLNVFNSAYVLAKPETATDANYQGIEGVIAHEYFHNWTGNRVTCRDWFQLSLKEGLTVFRDQEFSADMNSRAVVRINDVRMLRSTQFLEDAGPMAHPVRPESYVEINNFYTTTVYNKGAEVVRMYRTLLGKQGFRKGMDLYFKRHDGQAVATDDFYTAMEDANQTDLSPFKRWYAQAGTPVLAVTMEYDDERNEFTVKCAQSCADTPHQSNKEPFLIPVKFALVDSAGNDMPINCTNPACIKVGNDNILKISAAEQVYTFTDLSEKPVASLLREFSAPIKLNIKRSDDELGFLLANDNDAFSRWEAGQDLMSNALMNAMATSKGLSPVQYTQTIPQALGRLLEQHRSDQAFVAEALILPSEAYIAEQMDTIDVDLIHHVCRSLVKHIARSLKEPLLAIVSEYSKQTSYSIDAKSFGIRKLKNQALALLMSLEETAIDEICYSQFTEADNMTDQFSALVCFANSKSEYRVQALDAFYRQWHHDPLVMDKWLMVQASSRLPNTLTAVKELVSHSIFNIRNPNKVRALIGVFCHQNPINFHNKDGLGYQFLAEHVMQLEKINSRIAAGLLKALTRWKRYDKTRQEMMQAVLQQVLNLEGLSTDCFEIANKSLK